jgi:anti-sigma regulatory factor (Ser/Thr protein kinase)
MVCESSTIRDGEIECLVGQSQRFHLESTSGALRHFIRTLDEELGRSTPCDAATRMHIELALEEALTNALYHGNLEVSSQLRERDDAVFYRFADVRRRQLPYRDRRIEIELMWLEAGLFIAVRDEGPGFDVAKLPDPCDPENLVRATGRGVLLMRSVMDAVAFNESGNEVRMLKMWQPNVNERSCDPLNVF